MRQEYSINNVGNMVRTAAKCVKSERFDVSMSLYYHPYDESRDELTITVYDKKYGESDENGDMNDHYCTQKQFPLCLLEIESILTLTCLAAELITHIEEIQ